MHPAHLRRPTARDLTPGYCAVLAIAKAAQREVIATWLVSFRDGQPVIAAWSDHYASLSLFSADAVARLGPTMADVQARRRWVDAGTPRRYLNALAAAGLLEEKRWSGCVQYRYPRRQLDSIAAEVRAQLLADPPTLATGEDPDAAVPW